MTIQQRLEYTAARAALALFTILGPTRASALGGAITRFIGPLLPVSRVADRNLQAALPEADAPTRRQIIRAVWDNLGRTIGELPHLSRLDFTESGPGFELIGAEHLTAIPDDRPAIFFSAHFGNWEAFPPIAARAGLLASSVYRAAANPSVDALILSLRRAGVRADIPMFPKGASGARAAYAHLARGGRLGMVVDQKLNDGIEARLFGLPAMTAPAAAAFALKFRSPPIPGRVDRIGPARLRLTIEAPLPLPDTGHRQTDIATLTQAINDRLEAWIRQSPGAWLWLHRRWPREVIADPTSHQIGAKK